MKKVFILLCFITTIVLASKPYVILVSFDGFRWDYVDRDITPNFQKVIENGVRAISLRPSFPTKTFPNHYSIVTGQYPQNHGLIANEFWDLDSGEWYSMSNKESKWYVGEAFWETAKKNGITSASYYWPGSYLDDISRRPTYTKEYDIDKPYYERIDTVVNWLSLPKNKRPHFNTLYFHDTDTFGHEYGPNSPEINVSIQRCDSLVGYLMQEVTKIGLADSVNIIFVSDHGMTDISNEKTINIDNILDGYKYSISNEGPFMLIEPSETDHEKIKVALEDNQNHYKVYTKETIPDYYHYSDSDRIPEFILVADLGWYLATQEDLDNWGSDYNATHGYDNNQLDMHGIFIATGPAFKVGYNSGTVWNIDIYPLLCEIFGIPQPCDIDGKLERIEFVLKSK